MNDQTIETHGDDWDTTVTSETLHISGEIIVTHLEIGRILVIIIPGFGGSEVGRIYLVMFDS